MTTSTTEPGIAVREIWESTIDGRTSMEVTNPETGRPQNLSAKGKGQRIRITAEQRMIVEEGIRDQQNNPFRNGRLYRVNRPAAAEGVELAKHEQPSPDELDDETLAMLFDADGDDFQTAVRELSETNVRRLKLLAVEHDAKGSQTAFIQAHIEETYPIGGDTPTYREMQQRPDSAV